MRQKSGQVVAAVVAGALDKHAEGLGRTLEQECACTAVLAHTPAISQRSAAANEPVIIIIISIVR